MRIAIQGEAGSFHSIAATHYYGSDIEFVYCEDFPTVFESLNEARADGALVAIENSLFGSINHVYDLLLKYDFPIIGEQVERIKQNLIALPGTELRHITTVYSQPEALAQCREFLSTVLPEADLVEYYDTAASVAHIKDLATPTAAAIASQAAADLHGLKVLIEEVEDEKCNYTRFLALGLPGKATPTDANKASLVLQTNHQPGAIYKALGVFADAGVNLIKLQSRPHIGQAWKYLFYIDAMTAGDQLESIVCALQEQDCVVTILGQYKAALT